MLPLPDLTLTATREGEMPAGRPSHRGGAGMCPGHTSDPPASLVPAFMVVPLCHCFPAFTPVNAFSEVSEVSRGGQPGTVNTE